MFPLSLVSNSVSLGFSILGIKPESVTEFSPFLSSHYAGVRCMSKEALTVNKVSNTYCPRTLAPAVWHLWPPALSSCQIQTSTSVSSSSSSTSDPPTSVWHSDPTSRAQEPACTILGATPGPQLRLLPLWHQGPQRRRPLLAHPSPLQCSIDKFKTSALSHFNIFLLF